MALEHLPVDVDAETVSAALSKDGVVIIDGLAPPDLLERISDELVAADTAVRKHR